MDNLKQDAVPRPRVHLADGVCCIDFSPGTRIDVDMVEFVFHQRIRLMGSAGEKQKLLVTGNRVLTLDYAASRLSVSARVAGSIVACAVVSDSALERAIAALFTNLFKPPYPFRLFAHRDDALRWLATFPDH